MKNENQSAEQIKLLFVVQRPVDAEQKDWIEPRRGESISGLQPASGEIRPLRQGEIAEPKPGGRERSAFIEKVGRGDQLDHYGQHQAPKVGRGDTSHPAPHEL